MSAKIMEVHPEELKFIFELKKQSSRSLKLTNRTNYDVGFQVKTTSPKNYCVRPNVGIIAPKSTCEVTVTKLAQNVAPPDLVCKDKFLIQSTVVPVGTKVRDIKTSVFGKDGGKYIEDIHLRVALVSTPESQKPDKLVSEIEEMKTKLNMLESKLSKAEFTISKLTEERRLMSTKERSVTRRAAKFVARNLCCFSLLVYLTRFKLGLLALVTVEGLAFFFL